MINLDCLGKYKFEANVGWAYFTNNFFLKILFICSAVTPLQRFFFFYFLLINICLVLVLSPMQWCLTSFESTGTLRLCKKIYLVTGFKYLQNIQVKGSKGGKIEYDSLSLQDYLNPYSNLNIDDHTIATFFLLLFFIDKYLFGFGSKPYAVMSYVLWIHWYFKIMQKNIFGHRFQIPSEYSS